MYEKYEERGLLLFSVSYDDSVSHVRSFFEEKGFSYPVVMDRRMGGATGKSYQVGGIPTIFLIDAGGLVVERIVGFEPGDEKRLEERLLSILNKTG